MAVLLNDKLIAVGVRKALVGGGLAFANHSRTAQLKVSWSTKVGSAHGAAAVARH